jgi:hypothetical protein
MGGVLGRKPGTVRESESVTFIVNPVFASAASPASRECRVLGVACKP